MSGHIIFTIGHRFSRLSNPWRRNLDCGKSNQDQELTVEELARHDLALRENAADGRYLVFPSQFNRDYEDAPEPKGKALAITFDGPVQSQYKGREIKTIGDSFMAAFRSVEKALDYAIALQQNPGHSDIKIRAGIHIGPMQVEENDVFGGAVNFAARVVSTINGAEIWLSDRAKEDLNRSGAKRHKQLNWEQHNGVPMKGFSGTFTLWSLRPSSGRA